MLLFTLAALQACVSVPSKPFEQSENLAQHQQHLQKIAQIQQFSLQGRIGVQADGKGFSGNIDWQHSTANDELNIYSPLGSQVAKVIKMNDQVTLTDAKDNSTTAKNIAELTQQTLGWELPLNGLADWALGRPTKSPVTAITWDENGHIKTLAQDGWQLEYNSYTEINNLTVPNKISIRNPKVYFKLLVDNWQNICKQR